MSKTTNKFSPEVRTGGVRMVLEHGGEHPSRRAAVVSASQKIGGSARTLSDRVKKAEVDGVLVCHRSSREAQGRGAGEPGTAAG